MASCTISARRSTSVTRRVPPRRSMIPIRDKRLSSLVTASRCVLTRLAISTWVGAGTMRALLPSLGPKSRQPQQLSLNAVVHGQCAELVDPRGEGPNRLGKSRQQGIGQPRFRLEQFPERRCRHRGDQAIGARLHAGRPRAAVNGGEFAENLARAHLPEAHGLAHGRIDGYPDFAEHDEEDIVRLVEIVEDGLPRRIVFPGTTPLDSLDRVGRKRRAGSRSL